MVVLTDARQGPFYPTGQNIIAAMRWLVSEPETICFLHYSGHGSQVRDPDGGMAPETFGSLLTNFALNTGILVWMTPLCPWTTFGTVNWTATNCTVYCNFIRPIQF